MQIKPQLITSNAVSSVSFKRSNQKGLWPMLPLFSLALDAKGKKIIYTYAERCKYISELLMWGNCQTLFQTQSWRDLSHFCQHSQLGNFTQTFCIFSVEKCFFFFFFFWMCPLTLTAQFLPYFILILSFIFLLLLRKIPFILLNGNWRLPKTHQQEFFFSLWNCNSYPTRWNS